MDKIIEIVRLFGGKKDVAVFILFLALFFIVSSYIKNKKIRFLFSFFSAVFLILQFISLYCSQSFIGYQFYVHLNLRGGDSFIDMFMKQIIISVIICLLICLFNYRAFNLYSLLTSAIKKNLHKFLLRSFSVMSLCIIIILIIVKGDFVKDTKTLIPLLYTSKNKNFDEVLKKYNMGDYVTSDKIKSSKGKNIVIISLESLEKAFLNAPYHVLTPNLNRLKNTWSYVDMEENEGSSWTSGSLYTCLTGFPAYFGMEGNSVFQTAYDSKISSISEVVSKLNYQTTYINGNADFSGKKEILNTLKFQKIIDYKNSPIKGHNNHFGLRDKELFSIAKEEIKNLDTKKKPFMLFISTNDTHFPNGIYDKRMEPFISPKNSDLEFMVAALDYLIGDFIHFLENKNILENTSIFIFPDHLKMGDPSMFKNSGKRGLYIITNSKKPTSLHKEIYQIDLPKIILEGSNVKHNLKFLTDYIKENQEDYIEENIIEITKINTTGISNSAAEDFTISNISPNYEEYKKDTLRYIAQAGGKINDYTSTNSKEALDLSYKKGFRLFELDIRKTSDNYFVATQDWDSWAKSNNYEGTLPVSKEVFLSRKIHHKYTPLDMELINEWFKNHPDAILVTDKVNDPLEFSKKFLDKQRLMMELFDEEALEEGLNSNILSAMPSQSIIDDIDIDDIKNLAKKGVKNIVISRTFIDKNKKILQEFKRFDIKPFVFHVNYFPGIDEKYVTKYELDFVYGLYANEWDF